MTRLEFTSIENDDEMKAVIEALVAGKEYKTFYKNKEGKQEPKTVCKNGRLYIGSNYSISISKTQSGKYYIGVDYLSSDDRIQIKKHYESLEKK